MSSRRYLTISTAVFTLALMVLAVVEIIRNGVMLWTSAGLLYLVLVSVMLWVSRSDTTENTPPSSLPAPVGVEANSENAAQEIILNAIRTRGKAQRHDLLPQVGLSRSSLGRLLDQMDAKGLIRQEGNRKASYYVLAEKSGRNL